MSAQHRWTCRAAAVGAIVASIVLTSCSSSGSGSSGLSGPSSSTSGDLVIKGETIADKALYDAAKAEGKVVLYTTQTDIQQKALNAEFTKDTGIQIEYFRDGGASLTQRIIAEAGGGVRNVDVIVLTSPFDMGTLNDKGLLASYKPTTLGTHLAASGDVGANDKWYPNSVTLFVIGVNTGVVDKGSVKTWDDIVSAKFKGELGITPAGIGGSGLAQAAFETEVLGADYLTKLGAAKPVIFNSTATVAQNLATGDISVAIGGEPAFQPLINQGAPIELVYPKQGAIGIVGYQAMAQQAPHSAAAKLFYNWSMSKRGQELQSSVSATRSIRGDVNDPGLKPARADIKVWMSNLTGRAATKDALIKQWNTKVGYSG